LKLLISKSKSRQLYFSSKAELKKVYDALQSISDNYDIHEYYKFTNQISEGAYGIVYKGFNKATYQPVAIKRIKKDELTDEQLELQKNEIEVLKVGQHPNVIQMIDVFESLTSIYLVLEYMPGGDLYDYLKDRNFQISEERAMALFFDIAKGVQYLHSLGIVHRDLKLENIMMSDNSKDAVPRVVDFGLVTMMGPQQKANETLGTLAYAAPEVIQSKSYDAKCDVWSLGVVLHLLLVGSYPFMDKRDDVLMNQILKTPFKPTSKRWEGVSQSAQSLTKSLLLKPQESRPSLSEVLKHAWFAPLVKGQAKLRSKSFDFKELDPGSII